MYFLPLLLTLTTIASAKSFLPASFSAQYENTWQSATGSTKKENGSIDYKFPGSVKLDVKGDAPTTYVTNGKSTWLYQPSFVASENGQVTVGKASGHPVIKFLDSMRSGFEKSSYFTAKENGKDLVLTFNAVGQKEFSLKEVVIHGTKAFKEVNSLKDVDNIELRDINNLSKKIKFLELNEGVNFPASHFIFAVPPKTKVIKG